MQPRLLTVKRLIPPLILLGMAAASSLTPSGRDVALAIPPKTTFSGNEAGSVFISEFMADNDRTLNDEDGDSSDWIEIFNSGSTTASLNGWFLTDDRSQPTKRRFPVVAIAPIQATNYHGI